MSLTIFVRGMLMCGAGLATVAHASLAFAQPGNQETTENADQRDNIIIVTASRRAEAIDDVGLAIQAFSGEQLDNLQVNSTEDLQLIVPSLSVSRGYQGIPIYTLRGIGFNTINLSATSTVGTYQDEVALAYPFMNSGPVYDLERVEVLKGPQGTLYGRNTTGGLVNFITAKPKFGEFSGGVTVEGGSQQTLNSEAFLNIPIGDAVAARFAFRTEDSWEGWQHSISRDEKLGEVHRYGGRLTVTAEPTDGMKIEIGANVWVNKSDTLAGQAVGFTPNTNPASGTIFSLFNAPGLPQFVADNAARWDSNSADWAPRAARGGDIGSGPRIDGPFQEDG